MKYYKKSKATLFLSSFLLFTILCGAILTGVVLLKHSSDYRDVDNKTLLPKYSYLKPSPNSANYSELDSELDSVYFHIDEHKENTNSPSDDNSLTVLDIKKENVCQVAQSGSFTANDNQTLSLNIISHFKTGNADLFLFSPDGKEYRISINSSSLNKDIELTHGVWAFNCTCMFKEGGNITITGTIN